MRAVSAPSTRGQASRVCSCTDVADVGLLLSMSMKVVPDTPVLRNLTKDGSAMLEGCDGQ